MLSAPGGGHNSGSNRPPSPATPAVNGTSLVISLEEKMGELVDAMNKGHKIGGGGVVINIENNTGNEIQQDTSTSFDGEKLIVNTMLSAITRNKFGARDVIKGAK